MCVSVRGSPGIVRSLCHGFFWEFECNALFSSVEAMVPYKGSVVEILRQLSGGLRSGLSYCGAKTIAEMQKNAEFIKMTSAGFLESQPHDVDLM